MGRYIEHRTAPHTAAAGGYFPAAGGQVRADTLRCSHRHSDCRRARHPGGGCA